jgi:OTU domain-containing protein 6
VKADGHCLYHAIEDQLVQASQRYHAPPLSATSPQELPCTTHAPSPALPPQRYDYQQLRTLAASHIRSHPDEFLPFIYDEEAASNATPDQQLEGYCNAIESTAAWGGQVELKALAQALQCCIKVHAAGTPLLEMGIEFCHREVLQLCYLRHAFGLGEHYNSVVPLQTSENGRLLESEPL